MRTALILLLAFLAAPAWTQSLYPMGGGNLRRENRSLSPTSTSNPLQVRWEAAACGLVVPAGGPVVLQDRVIQCFFRGVRCVDRATGAQLWRWNSSVEIYNTPTYDPDRDVIYICRMDGSTLCLSPQTGQVLWYFYETSAAGLGQFCSPVYAEGRIFTGNGSAGLACLDPDTHAVIWRFNYSDHLGVAYRDGICNPAYDNGLLYFTTRRGHMFCVRASDGSLVWHQATGGTKKNGLLLGDDHVYSLGTMGRLECRRRTDGSLVWSTRLTGLTDGNLSLCGDLLIVPGDSWRIWGIDRHTGNRVWCTRLTGNFARNTPFVSCGKVYISACHGDYYGLDGQTGAVEWRYHHGSEITFVEWGEADGGFYVATRDGRMFRFEPENPGNPAECVCDLSSIPAPTATCTPTATPTATVTGTVPPGTACGGTCVGSSTASNRFFFDPGNAAPPADAASRDWKHPDHQEGPAWAASRTVTQPPGEWVPTCGGDPWIGVNPDGLPPTLADTYFRNTFDLPPGAAALGPVTLSVSGDNVVEAWLNGNYLGLLEGPYIGDSHLYDHCEQVVVDPAFFRPGRNVLAFRLVNQMTFHGLNYRMCLSWECGPDVTPTPTPTPTPSPTPDASATPTPTVTPSPTATPHRVCDPNPYPNPCREDRVRLRVAEGPYDDIRVRVFTPGLRRVCERRHACEELEEEVVTLELRDDHGRPLANGLYYVEIETERKGNVRKYIRRCVVAR